MTSSYPGASTPVPGVHNTQAPAPQVPPMALFTGFIEELFGALAVALGGINILGFQPLAFLQQWGQSLEAQGAAAIAGAQAANSTANAAITVQAQQSTAKPGYLAVDASADAVFPIANIQGATPTTVPLSAGASVIGFIPTPDNGKKLSVIWLGQNTTGLTGFFINVWKMNTVTGVCSLVNAGVNIVSSVSNTMAWNYYDLTVPITTEVGAYYAAEAVVTGSGTYQIAGMPNHWLPANANVYPQQMAATRAPMAATYDATGGGYNGTPGATTASFSWSHTATADAGVVVSVAIGAGASTPTTTVTYGGTAMTLLGTMSTNNGGGTWIQLFGLASVPGGTKTVAVHTSATSTINCVAGQSTSYVGCGGFGTPVTAYGTNFSTPSVTVSSALQNMVVAAFVAGGSSSFSMTGFTGTQRYSAYPNNGSNYLGTVMGDTPGTSSSTVSLTVGGGGNYWGVVAVDILPTLENPVPPTMTPTYSPNVPWFGFGGSVFAGPTVTSYTTQGTYVYTIPNWMKWGDKIDCAALGAGGGGQSAYGWAVGQGGASGTWSTQTLVYGVDIPITTTTLTVVVGAQGAGGLGGTIGQPGFAGGDTTVAGTGLTTITAPGGNGGNGGTNGTGVGPGPVTFNGVTYPGGSDVGLGTVGSPPGGGGGAGGVWGNGANGADGAVTLTAYQAGTNP